MIVVRITGGLGNQMFQYAFARALQARGKNVAVQWHGSRTILRHWQLDTAFCSPLSEKITVTNNHQLLNIYAWASRKTMRQREPADMSFNRRFLEINGGYIDGYWQTEKYFADIAETIRNDFQFKPLSGAENLRLQEIIAARPYVSVHVRRSDYVGHSGLGDICTPDYYRRALGKLNSIYPGCTPIIFSDDIPYCRSLFAGQDAIYTGWNCGANSWMDMALMSQCTHHIIANSSFSWWGAWLGQSPDGVVIVAQRWFSDTSGTKNRDIYPRNWIAADVLNQAG